MQSNVHNADGVFACTDCISGASRQVVFANGTLKEINEIPHGAGTQLFVGPGLIDLQVNGINGIDFNNTAVTEQDIISATNYLLGQGVTTFMPTIITNSDDDTCKLLQTITKACVADPLVNDCVVGIHLEGPFISPVPGAKGAHNELYIKAPDWELFERFQRAAGGKIKLITLAPEWDEAPAFIERCRSQNVIVSIGHTLANAVQISSAVNAGVTMCTHLGNAVPLVLPRHPNILWDLLASDELYACLISDGLHLPDSFMKVVMRNKADKVLLVSDATCYAGMPAGEYETHIGGTVVVDEEQRVSLKHSPGLLAGAAKTLLQNVATLKAHGLATLGEAWQMASVNVADFMRSNNAAVESKNDLVLFSLRENEIQVQCVIKNGKVVFATPEILN